MGGSNETFEHKCLSGNRRLWDDCCIGTVSTRNDHQGKILGPWQLVSFKATAGDKVSYPLGEHPGGYIEITPTRYWLMAIDPARKAPAAATLTDAESVSLMK